MNDATVGRNYADTLLTLAKKHGEPEAWGTMIADIAAAMRDNPMLKTVLGSPKIAAAQKIELLNKALDKKVPPMFLRFLEALVAKRRQMLIPSIAAEYQSLIDESEDRVHANVTLAREAGEPEKAALAKQLSKLLGKRVVPHITLNPAILGGVIVKVGDTVMDGSVRRRLATLKSRMVSSASK